MQNSNDTEQVCPRCGSKDLHFGYGLVGGGIGSYTLCLSCAHIFDKVQDPEAEFDKVQDPEAEAE